MIFIVFSKASVYNRGVTPKNLLVLRKVWGAVGRFGVRLAWVPILANWITASKLTCPYIFNWLSRLAGQRTLVLCVHDVHFLRGKLTVLIPKLTRPTLWKSWRCGWTLLWGQPRPPGATWVHPSLQNARASLSYSVLTAVATPSSLNVNTGAQSPPSASGQQDSERCLACRPSPHPLPEISSLQRVYLGSSSHPGRKSSSSELFASCTRHVRNSLIPALLKQKKTRGSLQEEAPRG